MIAFLALGSNLGDRRRHLREAVAALSRLDPDLQVSQVFETEPVGGPEGQPAYLNLVLRLATELSPHELLQEAQRLEEAHGRVRTVRNGPRTLDVDVLLYGDLTLDEEDLTIPHPRMNERAFVLAPLEELDATRVPAGWRLRLAAPLEELVRPVGTLF